jgi:hypothetical protein
VTVSGAYPHFRPTTLGSPARLEPLDGYATRNANLIPTVVLLGSFLVSATFVAWAFQHRHSGEVTGELVFRVFAVGGVLDVLGASLLESYLLHPSPWLFLGVEVARGYAMRTDARWWPAGRPPR